MPSEETIRWIKVASKVIGVCSLLLAWQAKANGDISQMIYWLLIAIYVNTAVN